MKRTMLLSIAVFVCLSPVANAIVYNIIDLGAGHPYSINNNGQIVGEASGLATLFDSTGGGNNINLGNLPWGGQSSAYSINNNGQIVGDAQDGGRRQPILFDATGGGSNINLGGLSGENGEGGRACSINDNGQIVGYTGSTTTNAILFKISGGNNIRLFYYDSSAYSINDNGQIVGCATTAKEYTRAMLFDATGSYGNNINLGTLPGGSDSIAKSINDNGQIVGEAENATGYTMATLFDSTGGGSNINLGTLGGDYSYAKSINDNGQIVGLAWNATGDVKAALFDITGSGANIDLNTLIDPTLGWNLEAAYSINDNGWIVGTGINPDGYNRAYLLTPIPEPASLLLLGLGGLLIRKR